MRKRFYSVEEKEQNILCKRSQSIDRVSKLLLNEANNSDEEDRTFRESLKMIKSNHNEPIVAFKSKGDPEDNSIVFDNDYSFMKSYIQLNSSSQSPCQYPSIFKFDLQVVLRNYVLEEDNLQLFNYVKYQMDGFIDNREFSVGRRYKEFLAYRKLMVKNWPGLFIPPIPPKKSFGNLEEGFILLRKKFLQQFFNKICASPHLASSYETKLFLESRNENFIDLPFEIYCRPIIKINEMYSSYFHFLLNMTLSSAEKAAVHSFYNNLTKTRDYLENLLCITTQAQNDNLELQRSLFDFYESFYEFDNNYIYDMFKFDKQMKSDFNKDIIECRLTESMYRTKFENSFSTFYEWTIVELIDFEAMIECISKLFLHNEIFEKKLKALKTKNSELEKLSNPGYVTNFMFSIDLVEIQNKTNVVNNLRKEVEATKNLIDLIYKILYFIEIPTFKRDKCSFYTFFLKRLVENEMNMSNKLVTIVTLMKSHCENILKYYEQIKK